MDHDQPFYQSIARATGEDLDTICSRGFQPLEADAAFDEPDDRPPLMIDWDRHVPSSSRRLLAARRAA